MVAADHFDKWCQKARQSLAEGEASQARQFYLHALAERADAPDAHYGLATACFLLNDLDNAVHHFREVVRIDPLRAGAYINLGAIYDRQDKLDEAVKALLLGIQLDSRRSEAYYNLGLVYRRQGQMDMAVQAYNEALRLSPRMVDAHYNLANLLLELGRYSLALVHYEYALDIDPDFEKANSDGAAFRTSTHLSRVLDANADGPLLSSMHAAVSDAEQLSRSLLKILEQDLSGAVRDLSSSLLYPAMMDADRMSHELRDRLRRFESSLQNMQSTQWNLQQGVKKLLRLGDRLLAGVSSRTG
jgi:tetratricopeptide (TPR) repeat protein